MGYIKSSIEFEKIQKSIDAAIALDEAEHEDMAKEILVGMAKDILEELDILA